MPVTADAVPDSTAASWKPPRPAEIPALHDLLQEWVINPYALAITTSSLAEGRGTIIPAAATPLESAVILHDEEASRLRDAQLFAVDAAMTAKARGTGALLPDWSIRPEDLPCEQGFLVFETPIGHVEDGYGANVPIVACSWGRSAHCEPEAGAVWLTFWAAPAIEQLVQEAIDGGMSPAQARWHAEQHTPPLLWDDEALLCWSAGEPELTTVSRYVPSDEVTGVIAHGRTLGWIQTVLATWLLIQQPVHVEITEERAPRPERRRAERAGRTLPPVRVVSIHRRIRGSSGKAATSSGRKVGVRSQVGPFWRDQAYGKGWSLRKRILIDEHWRGPDDAHVLLRPRVTLVDAPPEQAE
ncbi:hypothetical protein ACIA5G_51350 [Amycolatopsis sp. NPDC051758]|uniref:hypothetical protein n=1 Tax=Amycolatopsis sp. NPDC051758 TaxID=3363935 RepID=UPI0037B8B577